jgi:nicotinate dehydrogenase large molybdopterin subunit
MNLLAELAGMDPWQFRKLNLREADDPGSLGQRILPTETLPKVWQSIADSEIWSRPFSRVGDNSEPWVKRGVGAALAMHGSGLGYGIPDPGGGRLSLTREGKLEVAFSFEEFGQGVIATLEFMLMELFHCDADDLSIVIGDTDKVPHSGSSTASRSTTIAHMALSRLHPQLSGRIIELAAKSTGKPASQLATGAGGIWFSPDEGEAARVISYSEIAKLAEEELCFETEFHFPITPDPVVGGHYLYTCAAVAVEVEVNILTGAVKLLGKHHVVAAGPAVNPMGYIGQIEGGSVMAQGFTLSEDALLQDGHYKTENLDTYIIPTICDMAEDFTLHAIEELPQGDPYGPRGIGEVGSIALAPAITLAVHNAIGKRINRLPIRREELMGFFPGMLINMNKGAGLS